MNEKRINKFNKYIEYLETKIKILSAEKRYYGWGYRLKYIIERHDSNKLIVVFSGCTRKGVKARYNYIRTLRNININKLFILDDFGYDHRGAYYLGHNNDFKIQDLVFRLINMIKKQLKIKQIIYAGSSKGGYAALYFGLPDPKSVIIAGAPQYKLGNYLNAGIYIDNSLKYIIGQEITDQKINILNNLLCNRIAYYKDNDNKIYLHFSKKDYTYDNHIKYLLNDLNKFNYKYYTSIAEYRNHSDVSLYFPKYLIESITKFIN